LKLSPEQVTLDKKYKSFSRNGANLTGKEKKQITRNRQRTIKAESVWRKYFG
jgi:hypothetical protein